MVRTQDFHSCNTGSIPVDLVSEAWQSLVIATVLKTVVNLKVALVRIQ